MVVASSRFPTLWRGYHIYCVVDLVDSMTICIVDVCDFVKKRRTISLRKFRNLNL
jgi:hypothetical protein